MKNSATATVHFYFKGEKFEPSIEVDFDKIIAMHGVIPALYTTIAKRNGIDSYSYEYEMMEAEPVTYSNATGVVTDFISEGQLDTEGFIAAWYEQRLMEKLATIAKQHLEIDNLEEQAALKAALSEAYRLGRAETSRD
ncbi:hypothetical protein BOW53_07715 [Solemya pervernicosa gill symbiont]|uniref:Uncharacterized protein n=2 Tax=Gammaproteobacteria incertae sedis TaxID=118884 RepID=A0A1T2L5U1_9GAMM|nr:hypothetical protein [Candidatus Reidiella endopervernicosa]OOZ40451.1 hypothetical protein BOW53_07715 [Solemya pervernicosa gill symbiont]QKQ25366.1 hypothetical protein HUE57_02975 [Candidatus Reidiella endopervernicosa]